jgi:integrase
MFCKYCRHETMRRRNRPANPTRHLTEDAAGTLKSKLGTENVNQDVKDMVTLVLNTGMRIREFQDLRWKDVNPRDRNITISQSMSGHIRRIPYDGDVAEMLQRRRSASCSEYVFKGAPPSFPWRESRQLRDLGQRLLGRNLSFNDLRHTFFANLVKNGADLATLMSIGGWRSPMNPLRYGYSNPARVQAAYEEAMRLLQE